MARTEPSFDKRGQFQKIEAALLHEEPALGVFDIKGGGTGFLGETTMRVIIYDKAFA